MRKYKIVNYSESADHPAQTAIVVCTTVANVRAGVHSVPENAEITQCEDCGDEIYYSSSAGPADGMKYRKKFLVCTKCARARTKNVVTQKGEVVVSRPSDEFVRHMMKEMGLPEDKTRAIIEQTLKDNAKLLME